MTNSTERLGSVDPVSWILSSEPMVMPLSRTGVPFGMPLASSIYVRSSRVLLEECPWSW